MHDCPYIIIDVFFPFFIPSELCRDDEYVYEGTTCEEGGHDRCYCDVSGGKACDVLRCTLYYDDDIHNNIFMSLRLWMVSIALSRALRGAALLPLLEVTARRSDLGADDSCGEFVHFLVP